MSALFSPFTLRSVTAPHRVWVAPMCQYSAVDGFANDWHFAHLGGIAIGRAALTIVEATAVTAQGRITPADLGLWRDEQIAPLARIAAFLESQGSVPAIQLAHAGRKASTHVPWKGGAKVDEADGGWEVVAPSAIPFNDVYPHPRELTHGELEQLLDAWEAATRRALAAGFKAVEIHSAHGYLLNEFLSPLSNTRTDEYGGGLAGRMRFPLEVIRRVRAAWPAELPLLLRISAAEWVPGGFTPEEAVIYSAEAKALGVDLVDCSSGGNAAAQQIPAGPGYQVRFAELIRHETGVATGAVGMITEARQAEEIVASGQADVVLLARELLRDPHWPLRAAQELGAEIAWPNQYLRAAPFA